MVGGWALAIDRHNEQFVASPILAKGNEVSKGLAKFVLETKLTQIKRTMVE